MEKMVFQSPKKHRIIAIKNLLTENNIPVTNIKLHIRVEWSHGGGRYYGKFTETREKRNELNVPIEEFDEKLNDAQTFELYTDAEHEDEAIALIEDCDEETFFGDCIFRTKNYDEAFEMFLLLNKNKIPCDEVFPGVEDYLLFIDPLYTAEALKTIERNQEDKFFKRKNRKAKEPSDRDYQKSNLFKTLFSTVF